MRETASSADGRFLVDASYPCPDESRFRELIRKGMYVGDVRQHAENDARILFLEDRRPVVLTTDPARVA